MIQARIIKLRKEHEKANKRIRDMQRKQMFIDNMNVHKKAKIDSINELRASMK